MSDKRWPAAEGWPDHNQELLLKAGFLKGRGAVDAWTRWREQIKISELDIGSRAVLPLVHRNLLGSGAENDPAMAEYIRRLQLITFARNNRLFKQIKPLLALLDQEGFPTLILKGAALSHLYYGGYGLRSMSDVDLLIRTEQVMKVISLLGRSGWRPAPRDPERFTRAYVKISHSHEFIHEDGRRVDLHWHVLPECCRREDDFSFWDAAVPFEFSGIPTLALDSADQLLHIAVHGSRFSSTASLRWLADVMTVLRNPPTPLDWDRLIGQAGDRRLVLPVREVLEYVRLQLDAPVPESVTARLHDIPVSRWERFEYHYKRQDYSKKPLGYFPLLWFDYYRLEESAGLMAKGAGFARYMQQFWGTNSLSESILFFLEQCGKRIKRFLLP